MSHTKNVSERIDILLKEQQKLKQLPFSPKNGIRLAAILANLALLTGTDFASPKEKEHPAATECSGSTSQRCTINLIPF